MKHLINDSDIYEASGLSGFCDLDFGNHVKSRLKRLGKSLQNDWISYRYTINSEGEFTEIWGTNKFGQEAKIYPFRFI